MGVIGEFADLDARKHYNGFVFCAPFLLKKKNEGAQPLSLFVCSFVLRFQGFANAPRGGAHSGPSVNSYLIGDAI